MNDKVKKAVIVLIVFLAGYYSLDKYMTSDVEVDIFADIYLHLWNGNLNIGFLLVFLLGFQELCVIDSYNKVNEGFDRYIITRVGYFKYYYLECKRIVVKSVFYYLILHILLLISTFIAYGYPSNPDIEQLKYHLFSNNPNSNIAMFIILSTIGVTIFNCFIFSFSSIIKNKYVYRFLPLLLLIISVMLSTVFSTFIQGIFGYDEFIKTIGSMFMVPSILQPGMAFMVYGYTAFISAALCYIMMFVLIIGYSITMRYRYEK